MHGRRKGIGLGISLAIGSVWWDRGHFSLHRVILLCSNRRCIDRDCLSLQIVKTKGPAHMSIPYLCEPHSFD